MEYYMKKNKKGYSNNEEDQEEEFEEDTHHHTTKYSSPCYNYGSSSSSSKNLEAINFMDLSLRNGKEDDKSNNGWPPKSEMEHMFDKVVTPSDVGKLNRLVIPKQHAEKYFPLDSSANEKGLLLNFRDRAGKPWRFRYSYWNSSQSYVMTKGWSRFVKDKKLDPGDIVSFIRSAKDSNVMYIDWRRRLSPPQNTIMANLASFWGGGGRFAVPHFRVNPYQFHRQHYHHGAISPGVVIDSVPLVQHHQCQQGKTIKSTSNKRLRLFGVNMECSSSITTTTTTVQEEDEVECQILSSRVAKLPPHYHHLASSSSSSLISQQQQPMELKVPNLLLSEKGKPNSLSFYLDP